MKIPFNCKTVKLTSPYGNRALNGSTSFHGGYDLVGVGSYDIVAVDSGTVIRSRIVTDKRNSTWQWGNYVCIKTDSGQYHYYCHMKSRSVSEGDRVEVGKKIGVMGNTGYSFGAHLHFEVRKSDGKTTISPYEVLGIPNTTGQYSMPTTDEALDVLLKHGVINSPGYWSEQAKKVKYLPELILNMAEALKK